MITRTLLALALGGAALFLAPTPASAAPKPGPFAAYKGTYTGTGNLTVSGSPFSGALTVTFASPSRGKRGEMTLSGSFGTGVSPYTVNGKFAFTRTSFTLDQAVLQTITTGYPISGKAGISRKKITFSGSGITTSETDYVASGTIVPTFLKRRTILNITYTIDILGVPTKLTATVSRPVKPAK